MFTENRPHNPPHSDGNGDNNGRETESIPWLKGIYDAHCHPTDMMASIEDLPNMKASCLAIMSTRSEDQHLVAQVAAKYAYGPTSSETQSSSRTTVIPSFGYHPWFSHFLYDNTGDPATSHYATLSGEELKQHHYPRVLTPQPDASSEFIKHLPVPRPLSLVLAEVAENLSRFPHALVGEIGMDRAFRLPEAECNGEGHGRKLSVHRVSLFHQKAVFKAQLCLAGRMGRAVSVHGVQCHGAVFDTFRELWSGNEIPRTSERRKDQRQRRRKVGDTYEYLPDICDSSSDEEDNGNIEKNENSKNPTTDTKAEGAKKKVEPFPPRICLHSFSAPLETLHQYLSPPSLTTLNPSRLFFSFSTTINARSVKGHLSKIQHTITAVPDHSLLIESDLHTAGNTMDEALAAAAVHVCNAKGWDLESGVSRLGEN